MLTISPAATAAIQTLSLPHVPERSGLRIVRHDREPSRLAAVVDRPQPDDEVIAASGDDASATLFVDPGAVELVGDRILDASTEAPVTFCLQPRRSPVGRPSRSSACPEALPLLRRGERRPQAATR